MASEVAAMAEEALKGPETPLPASVRPGLNGHANGNGVTKEAPIPEFSFKSLQPAVLQRTFVAYLGEKAAVAKLSAKKLNAVSFAEETKKYELVVGSLADSEALAKSNAGKHIKKAVPYLAKAAAGGALLSPFAVIAVAFVFDAYSAVLRYTPPEFIPALWGFVLCFFGGEYITLIALVEAYQLCGGDKASAAAAELYAEASLAIDASMMEDAGIAALAPKELAAHKAALVLRVVDPAKTQLALGELYMVWMAVLATLKIQFARTVALALSINGSLKPAADKFVVPAIEAACAPDFKKWVPVAVETGLKGAVVVLAWMLTTLVATVQSALRGGPAVAKVLIAFGTAKKFIKTPIAEGSHTFFMVAYAVAAAGILFQVVNGWGVPFPLNIFTAPLDVAEWMLRWQIGHDIGEPLA